MRMTSSEVVVFLGQLDYVIDERQPPDTHRRGRFKAGWRAATDRGAIYREDTLRSLTWDNLGYRSGVKWGPHPDGEVEQVFQILADVYEGADLRGVNDAREIGPGGSLVEGAVARIEVNRYERDPVARRLCIQKHGSSCVVCRMNFGQTYGLFAEGYIHVHHLRPLAEIGQAYVVDPENDLRPICPNCHAVVHRRNPPFTLDEVASFLRGGRPTLR